MASPGTVVRVQCGERSADYTADFGSSQMILVHTPELEPAPAPEPDLQELEAAERRAMVCLLYTSPSPRD